VLDLALGLTLCCHQAFEVLDFGQLLVELVEQNVLCYWNA
jgi:hypothetical protein